MDLNTRERTVSIKIVYYGPAVGGKTTNLKCLHDGAGAQRRGEMVSVNSGQDRTILFDLLPLKAAAFRGFDLRIQLHAVPGQAMYAATRRLLLRGVDAVVFVANSAADRFEDNLLSFHEMIENLRALEIDWEAIPMVLQYNKQDLPEVTPIAKLEEALNGRKLPNFPAVTLKGEGVLETFSAALRRVMQEVCVQHRLLALAPGQTVEEWVQEAVVGMFGATTLAEAPPASEASAETFFEGAGEELMSLIERIAPEAEKPAAQRSVTVGMPAGAERMAWAGPDARANETLVESYAQASADLTQALEKIREERDLAWRWLDDVRQSLAASLAMLSGEFLEPACRATLSRMARAVDSRMASLLLTEPGDRIRTAARLGLDRDPLVSEPLGRQRLADRFLLEIDARVHGADALGLAEPLGKHKPPIVAVGCAPLWGTKGLRGLVMLYFSPDSRLPDPEVMTHVGSLGRSFALSLDIAQIRADEEATDAIRGRAVFGTAAVRTLGQIEAPLAEVEDVLRRAGGRPDLPLAARGGIVGAAEVVAGAAESVRSLVAFDREDVRYTGVSVPGLLQSLAPPGLELDVDEQVGPIQADATLLRLALGVLLGCARRVTEGRPKLQGSLVDGELRLELRIPSAAAPSGLDLELARRIAEVHGGGLVVSNEAGGLRLVFTLPAA